MFGNAPEATRLEGEDGSPEAALFPARNLCPIQAPLSSYG